MEKKVLSAKQSALGFVLSFAVGQMALMVFTLLGCAIASSFGVNLTKFEAFLNNSIGYFISVFVLNLAFVCVFVFTSKNTQNNIVAKPHILKILLYMCLAIVAFFALYPIIACLDSLFVKLGANLTEIPYALTYKNLPLSIITFAIIPAICEELVFRGLVFKGLKKHGKSFSIVLSAVMFAIFHMSYQQFVYPLLFGLLLAVIMYYENNIIYTIIAHATNNILSLLISLFGVKLFFNHWAYFLLAIFLVVAFLSVVLYFVFNKKNQFVKEKLEVGEKKYLIVSFAIMIFLWVIINIFNR